MKLDWEEVESFQRRPRRKSSHGLIAFSITSIVVLVSLYALHQNKNRKLSLQEQKPVSKADQPINNWNHPSQVALEQPAYQPKPESAYVPHPQKTTVFKCILSDSHTIYSEAPCVSGATTQIVTLEVNAIDSSVLRNKASQLRAMAARAEADPPRGNVISYMPEVEVWRRINELEMDLHSITATQEKINAAKMEVNILKSKRVKQLSYEDENSRAGLVRLLNSINSNPREEAFNEIINLIWRAY